MTPPVRCRRPTSESMRTPRATSRIERLGRTFQDRLTSELRLAGARTHDEAFAQPPLATTGGDQGRGQGRILMTLPESGPLRCPTAPASGSPRPVAPRGTHALPGHGQATESPDAYRAESLYSNTRPPAQFSPAGRGRLHRRARRRPIWPGGRASRIEPLLPRASGRYHAEPGRPVAPRRAPRGVAGTRRTGT